MNALLDEVLRVVPVEKLSVHFHDTYGQALANVLIAIEVHKQYFPRAKCYVKRVKGRGSIAPRFHPSTGYTLVANVYFSLIFREVSESLSRVLPVSVVAHMRKARARIWLRKTWSICYMSWDLKRSGFKNFSRNFPGY